MLVTQLTAPIRPATLPWDDPHGCLQPMASGVLQVAMGQVKIGAGNDRLQALLGSCVGIALIWKKQGRCALAHCLLPETADMTDLPCARYVSQAVPSLLRLLGASVADYADLEVIVAGGATMLNGCSSRLQIGQQNADAARRHLRKFGLNISYCRVGGKSGRTLHIDCATCDYTVQDIVPPCPGAAHA